MRSNVAHLDITSNNIMLRNQDYAAWDQVRLIDFGYSQECCPGTHAASCAQNFLVWMVYQLPCCTYTSPTMLGLVCCCAWVSTVSDAAA